MAKLTDAPVVATHAAAPAICPSTRNLAHRRLGAIRDADGVVGAHCEVSPVRPGRNQSGRT